MNSSFTHHFHHHVGCLDVLVSLMATYQIRLRAAKPRS